MSIHFIGIGGIGVSALARYYLSLGAKVSGSDLASSEITEELEKQGVKITTGRHKESNLPKDAEWVIYTAAVPGDNPELRAAKTKRLKILSYPQAVGELTKKYKTITVSGAHGKSTVTALAALVLDEGYFDPTVIVGTKVKEFGNSNFRKGYGRHLVLEADEWNKSFLEYSPQIAVVTNIDREHLDTYKNAAAVEKIFEKYLAKVPRDGKIIANFDDETLRRVAKKFGKGVVWYSLGDREAETVRRVIKIPGEHNVSNALAAAALGRVLGVCGYDIVRAIARFSGAWRRFEFKGTVNGAFVFSDYGHHPREIRATLDAARRRFPFRRIWCVYQPHQYQRLFYLWNDFIEAFDMADRVHVLPVYDVAGREASRARSSVNSKKLALELQKRGKNVYYQSDFEGAAGLIKREVRAGDVVLVMGAGDIYRLPKLLTPHLL